MSRDPLLSANVVSVELHCQCSTFSSNALVVNWVGFGEVSERNVCGALPGKGIRGECAALTVELHGDNVGRKVGDLETLGSCE